MLDIMHGAVHCVQKMVMELSGKRASLSVATDEHQLSECNAGKNEKEAISVEVPRSINAVTKNNSQQPLHNSKAAMSCHR
jgi:hypothetical protein